uniref:Uncharacterized protein n=1 Tax=Siphoviridae sp. ctsfh5 TaxID=2825697 RepID=A0A8S5P9I5_9CAUD|nr:MAG TPA: hypothetical protein [Siphoviridae sp. ctsfh5]
MSNQNSNQNCKPIPHKFNKIILNMTKFLIFC